MEISFGSSETKNYDTRDKHCHNQNLEHPVIRKSTSKKGLSFDPKKCEILKLENKKIYMINDILKLHARNVYSTLKV
jgi:hypothetical protein